MNLSRYREVFQSRRMAVTLLLGFSSGLPLALTGGTLQAWLASSKVDIHTIGLFAAVGIPYTLKFLWAPFMDRYSLPFLGRRRGWVLVAQLALMLGIGIMGSQSPNQAPIALAIVAVFVAFSSSSQDIVVDAYRTDLLSDKERGAGAAVSSLGYRVAMLLSGAGALILADHIGWQPSYWIMVVLMLIGLIGNLWGPEPVQPANPPKTLEEAVWGPIRDFSFRDKAILILLFIILYKIGDAFAGSLTTTFLLRGLGFSLTEVGVINKGFGFAATIVGLLWGGVLTVKLGLYRSLWVFGILQAVSNLTFMALAFSGKSYPIMVAAIAIENLCGGMGSVAFVALLMALCNKRFTATQYALMSALAALGRVFVGTPAGYVVEWVGWANFFFITFLTAIPGLAILHILRHQINYVDHESN